MKEKNLTCFASHRFRIEIQKYKINSKEIDRKKKQIK